MQLVTHHTGPEGKKVRKVLVEEASAIRKELYLSVVVDRSRGRECVVFMASEAGGMDIEQVAATAPEKIVKCAVNPAVGFSPFQARKLSVSLGLDAGQSKQFAEIVRNLYRLFLEKTLFWRSTRWRIAQDLLALAPLNFTTTAFTAIPISGIAIRTRKSRVCRTPP
jgi:succinyl-CoA synthetase beta subunit